MARQKKTSVVIEKAEVRSAALKSIDTTLELGNGLSMALYEAKINEVKGILATYNTRLSELDGLLNEFQAKEAELRALSSRMLAAVGAVYGKESSAYEQAGGTRTGDRGR